MQTEKAMCDSNIAVTWYFVWLSCQKHGPMVSMVTFAHEIDKSFGGHHLCDEATSIYINVPISCNFLTVS